MDYASFVNNPLSQRFVGQLDSLLQILDQPLDTTVMISPERMAMMRQNREIIRFQDGGYRDAALIEKTFELSAMATDLHSARENRWLKFFFPLWTFFDMENTFSST